MFVVSREELLLDSLKPETELIRDLRLVMSFLAMPLWLVLAADLE
jgi:hypothetical protein